MEIHPRNYGSPTSHKLYGWTEAFRKLHRIKVSEVIQEFSIKTSSSLAPCSSVVNLKNGKSASKN